MLVCGCSVFFALFCRFILYNFALFYKCVCVYSTEARAQLAQLSCIEILLRILQDYDIMSKK